MKCWRCLLTANDYVCDSCLLWLTECDPEQLRIIQYQVEEDYMDQCYEAIARAKEQGYEIEQ